MKRLEPVPDVPLECLMDRFRVRGEAYEGRVEGSGGSFRDNAGPGQSRCGANAQGIRR